MLHNVKCFKRNLVKKITKQFDISRLRLKHSWTKPAFTMGIYVVRPGCFWSPRPSETATGPLMAHIFGSVRCQSDSRFPLTPVRFNFSDQDFNERCRLRARQGILQLAYKWMLASIFSLPSGLPLQFRNTLSTYTSPFR